MRAVSLLTTIALLTVMVFCITILDHLYLTFAIIAGAALSGLALSRLKRREAAADIGIGMLIGSVTVFAFLFAFIVWLSYCLK